MENVKSAALVSDDPRYEDMLDVEKESTQGGHALIDDPYAAFAELRTQGPVFAGDI